MYIYIIYRISEILSPKRSYCSIKKEKEEGERERLCVTERGREKA